MDELDLFIEHYPNTLFQSSGRGMSLLCTCPTLTALSLATHAAGTFLHVM